MASIINVRVDPTSYAAAVAQILTWARVKQSSYVCIANVHMLMEAHDSAEFSAIVEHADLVTPDGMPLVWLLRLKGYSDQQRVYGPTLMLHILEVAARENLAVGFYGGAPEVLDALVGRLRAWYPGLRITFALSPPFRTLNQDEDEEIIRQITASKAQILFVGLGCPKQEGWMAAHRGRLDLVMIGVGAAFDFHAGFVRQAPRWMQGAGLEWSFRLIQEPRRLWGRYLIHNPRFVALVLADLTGAWRRRC
jgi:N-acetylglucosaminyldiphosphoundecaprenol N-acetyl-beta-D-mannosaminyltransferase